MGGKTWTKTEELLFWRTIIPQSPQAVNMPDRLNSWSQCADMMQEKMGHPRLRKYTKTMLYEHYYQNIKTRRHSPQARPFVREHMKEMNKNPQAHDELSAPAVPLQRSALPTSREKNSTAVVEDSVGERHFTAHNTEPISSLPRQPCSPFEALLIATKLNQEKKNSDRSSYASFSLTSASSGISSFGASSFESSSSGASSFESSSSGASSFESSSSGTSSSWTSSSETRFE